MNQNDPAGTVMAVATFTILAIAGITIWLIPVFVALSRHMPNRGAIIAVDLLLGWTGIGWIVALAMACGSNQPRQPYQPQWGPAGWQGPQR